MEQRSIRRFVNNISPLLTLKKINNCRREMTYIANMRNAFQFQIFTLKHCDKHIERNFNHRFLLRKTFLATFCVCLCHAFSEVLKFKSLVLKLDHISEFGRIYLDTNDILRIQTGNEEYWRLNINRSAIAYFEIGDMIACEYTLNWMTNRMLKMNIDSDIPLSNIAINPSKNYANLGIESTWRRVFESNNSYFCPRDSDIDDFVKEQTEMHEPVNVFKQIMNREIGYPVTELIVLEAIASPYYCILPHQDEAMYSQWKNYMRHSYRENVSDLVSCQITGRRIIVLGNEKRTILFGVIHEVTAENHEKLRVLKKFLEFPRDERESVFSTVAKRK
ncbi:uncharacterized protein NPIL_386741 [Nephila pilipes]|uniref:Uncharacterized protein n=1 Tax=Nephila pilipes TaxID=299642 RepID=A0A8X6NBH3_NEPPI|nr:uncharacterized protein NPIL_386741 [Nephila pilipes]